MIKLPEAVTDLTMSKLYVDGIMSKGSLYLMDLSHSLGYDNGVTAPINGTLIPNIAWEAATDIIGSGDRNSLSSLMNSSINGTTGKLEVTGKKGLHSIFSQTAHLSQHFIKIPVPLAIRTQMYSNPSHRYYFSTWRRRTRAVVTSNPSNYAHVGLGFTNTSNYFLLDYWHSDLYFNPASPATQNKGQRGMIAGNALETFIKNNAFEGSVGSPTVTTSDLNWYFFANGSGGIASFNANDAVNKAPSMILYRTYLEDLTISGRTYAEVDALDKVMYDAAFAVGGKFHGDTFTAPATIA